MWVGCEEDCLEIWKLIAVISHPIYGEGKQEDVRGKKSPGENHSNQW